MAESKKVKEEVVKEEKKVVVIKKTDIERFPEIEISENTQTILESRYLKKDLKTKKPIETARDLFKRVAVSIAAGSVKSEPKISEKDLEETEEIFYEMMSNRDFLPNSPTLMNAGRELPNLSACFVLPIEDSMDGIFDTLKDAALIHKSGGGTGFDFSELRSSGSNVKTTAGSASGPISFMSVFNAATETIKQGGVRRGANMGILRVDHPDIEEFIACKEDTSKFTNFNISVAITDEFMDAYKSGSDYNLYNSDKTIHSRKPASEIMNKIVDHSWSTGEPGIVFIDKINKKATLPGVGKIAATNPCGEQPLLPHEACNLGSINLSNFYETDIEDVNWERLKGVVHNAILFLDNVIEVGKFPIQKIHDTVLANRKIGLGVMGFADLLYKLRIPYNSDKGVTFGKKIMAFIEENAIKASQNLAKKRGSFPNIDKSIYRKEMRNSNVTTVAPTGTIGMIAETSGGVEPNFGLVYVKQVLDGEKLLYINPLLKEALVEADLYSEELMEKISETGKLEGIEGIPQEIKDVFVTSQEISPYYHVAMQSAFQEYVDSSISKTINFDNSASKEDILDAYTQAYDSACKGITVYRDGCRPYQVLNTGNKTNEDKEKDSADLSAEEKEKFLENINKPMHRPDVMEGRTHKVNTGEGAMYVTVNSIDGKPFELFASIGKAGGNAAAQSEAVSRLVSLALRSNIDIDVIIKQLIGIGSPDRVWHNGKQILSTPDAIGKILKEYVPTEEGEETGEAVSVGTAAVNNESDLQTTGKNKNATYCPKCNSVVSMQEGCLTCRSCGWSKCS